MTDAALDQLEPHDIVVIGASAGGVETLQRLVSGLPPGLPLAFLVVLHIAPHGSFLPEILTRAGAYEAAHPHDGDPVVHGRIVVAPPDLHLIIEDDVIRLRATERHNGARPAIDPLFESAAPLIRPGASSESFSPAASTTEQTGWQRSRRRGVVTIVQIRRKPRTGRCPMRRSRPLTPRTSCEVAEISSLLGHLAATESIA